MSQLQEVRLRYTIADREYWNDPAPRRFTVLEDVGKVVALCLVEVFYEIEARFEIEET
jgi:hypothetical protein